MPRVKATSLPTGLLRAAELRARGSSWESIAKEIRRTEKTIREWPRKYPREWRKAIRDAEQQFTQEAAAESVLTLRRQLRSTDEKVSREAAAALIKYAAMKRKPTPSKKTNATSKLTSQIAAVAEFVGGLTDDEIAALIRELRETPIAPGTAPATTAATAAIPA